MMPPARTMALSDHVVLAALAALVAAAELAYSQTYSFANDEGFHLVAAQLIGNGKRPYLDFFFPQTPLNAYWSAAWMGLLGQSWRAVHAVAALVVAAAVMLVADYVWRRCPDPAWKLPVASAAALLFGLNELVVMFGTLAQAYALCLLLIVGAFRCGVVAVDRASFVWSAGAGACAAAAAASSLLTAPVGAVLFAWMAWRAHARIRVTFAFCAGAIVPLLPLLLLFVQGPRQVVFNVLQYHGLFRQVGWPGAGEHNIEVYLAWSDSGHALVLLGLSAVALVTVGKGERLRPWRAELGLCAALAAAQAAYLCTIVPTHQRYFLLAVPWLAILAAAGLYAILAGRGFKRAAVVGLGVFLALATAKVLFESRDDYTWSDAETVAAKIEEVTPREAAIVAEESVYFLTRRTPPRGLEHSDSLKLALPEADRTLLHLTSKDELAQAIRAGRFATVEICKDDLKEAAKADELFAQSEEFEDEECAAYWGFKGRRGAPAPTNSAR